MQYQVWIATNICSDYWNLIQHCGNGIRHALEERRLDVNIHNLIILIWSLNPARENYGFAYEQF